jgi:cytochrome P450
MTDDQALDPEPLDYETVNFFRERALFADPYPYYAHMRERCPVRHEPHKHVAMITGYDEAVAVYSDPTNWSSCNSVPGPFPGFPVPLEGDDVSDIIDAHRDELPFSDQLPSFDPPKHTAHRALTMRLITPKRLKENEEFMWVLADRQIDEFLANGECEYVGEYAAPYTLLVIADLLGVPEGDHDTFRSKLASPVDLSKGGKLEHRPLEFLYEQFAAYIEDRRLNPRDDVMTGLATAPFPDGSTPPVHDVALIAANLFVAGQETTVRLLSAMLQTLGDRPDLQRLLRAERHRIPNFIEEQLRLASPIQGEFRLLRRNTTVGGVDLAAGTCAMVLNGAANRDPSRFENPDELDIDRVNARRHLAFGHGIHTCAGAPLARAEARVSLERLFDRTTDIRISESMHGPAGARRYDYMPTYLLHGLTRLHLEFTPVG